MRRFLFTFVSLLLTSNVSAHSHGNSNDGDPSDDYKLHICAFHIAKDNPNFIIETQHYCVGLSDEIFQCILFETTAKEVKPKLLGVEYVISDAMYQKLPTNEKNLWHPHDYEVRAGLLTLIGAPKDVHEATIKVLYKTWGKTWHTWPDPSTELPLGSPRLMWSATKDGAIPEKMIKERDERWHSNTSQIKKDREQYLPK